MFLVVHFIFGFSIFTFSYSQLLVNVSVDRIVIAFLSAFNHSFWICRILFFHSFDKIVRYRRSLTQSIYRIWTIYNTGTRTHTHTHVNQLASLSACLHRQCIKCIRSQVSFFHSLCSHFCYFTKHTMFRTAFLFCMVRCFCCSGSARLTQWHKMSQQFNICLVCIVFVLHIVSYVVFWICFFVLYFFSLSTLSMLCDTLHTWQVCKALKLVRRSIFTLVVDIDTKSFQWWLFMNSHWKHFHIICTNVIFCPLFIWQCHMKGFRDWLFHVIHLNQSMRISIFSC